MSNPAHPAPIPVLCDLCAARGEAGGVDFTMFGDLLDFEPVPRKKQRADGWTPEVQRYFIAALALTGSERQAAHAVGKAQFGVTQLKTAEGNESFMAAHAKAMAFYEAERSRRLSEGLQAAAAHAAHNHGRAPGPPWSGAGPRRAQALAAQRRHTPVLPAPAATEAEEEAAQMEALAGLAKTYMIKLGQEREARLAGRIAEADFYVRQISWFEAMLDLASGDGLAFLREFRPQGLDPIDIAATPVSLLLDDARRAHWAGTGEPPRPEHPPRHLIELRPDGIVTEPLETYGGGRPGSLEEQRAAFEARHREDAEAQVKWEALARRDYEERRDRDAAS